MVSPGVPGQLRDETVVLMPVVVVVGENEVRREARLEVLEGFLDELALERKKSVAKPMNDDFALGAGAGQEHLSRASRFLDPLGVLAAEHHPFHFELGVGLGQIQNRAAGPDFDVVAMGAETKQALHPR